MPKSCRANVSNSIAQRAPCNEHGPYLDIEPMLSLPLMVSYFTPPLFYPFPCAPARYQAHHRVTAALGSPNTPFSPLGFGRLSYPSDLLSTSLFRYLRQCSCRPPFPNSNHSTVCSSAPPLCVAPIVPMVCAPHTTNCCCRQHLYTQSDFAQVKSLLGTLCKSCGYSVHFLPKFHCELNFIEQCAPPIRQNPQ